MSQLEHHGIKGMKWGVRRETDSSTGKPGDGVGFIRARNLRINTERQNMVKARIAKNDILISELKADIDKINSSKMTVANYFARDSLKDTLKVSEAQRKADIREAKRTPTTGMTKTQKRVLIGVGVAAAIGLTAYAIANKEDIGAAARTLSNRVKGEDIFRKKDEFAKLTDVDGVFSNIVKGANPNYRSAGGMMNCRRVTFAYELRRRGYDVTATTSSIGFGQNETGLVNALIRGDKNVRTTASLSSFAKSVGENAATSVRTRAAKADKRAYSAFTDHIKFKDFDDLNLTPDHATRFASQIKQSLMKQPNGARGEIALNFKAFIHSMQYEVFDGVPHIFDSQKAAHYPVTQQGIWDIVNKWGDFYGAAVTRLDDVDLDLEYLAKWVTDR